MFNYIIRLFSKKNNPPAQSPRHPGNVPGDFYATEGCILCNAPATTAPNLIGYVKDGDSEHCVVIKQPVSILEIETMIEAMSCSCVECYRYSGTDRKIIDLLDKNNMSHLCDNIPT